MKGTAVPMVVAVLVLLAGCSGAPVKKEPIVPAKRPAAQYVKAGVPHTVDAHDPWEPMNRRIYNFNALFDETIYLPAVRAYEAVLPGFVQKGISNFFGNLTEVSNFANSMLQFKIVKALNTFARMAINTTVGLGGLIDVAAEVEGIPRENEDFGQTLGFYGIGPGPYLVLPILGPSNLRDTAGLVVDTVTYNLVLGELFDLAGIEDPEKDVVNYGLTALYAIDKRHQESFRYFMTGSPFEYDLVRKLTLLKREFLVEN